jgi:hypothetical protein
MAKKKIASVSVTVGREGKSVVVTPGTPFEFTADEIKDVERGYGPDVFRDPVNEDASGEGASAPAKPAGKTSGKSAEEKAKEAEAKKKAAAEKTAAEKTAAESGGAAGGNEGDDL